MTSATVRVEKATSDLLLAPDWTLNMDICDSANSDQGQAKDVIKALKKRLHHKSPKVQYLALTLLETLIKNCGDYVHMQVTEREILLDMVKIVRKKTDMQVRDKILVLLDSWQEAFGGPGGRYPQYYWAYADLKRTGVVFPQRLENSAPIFTPPVTHSHPVPPPSDLYSRTNLPFPVPRPPPQVGYGMPLDAPLRLDEAMASDRAGLSLSDLDRMKSVMELLSEMLKAVNPSDHKAVKDEVIADLVDQCRSNQNKLMDCINSTRDEELLGQSLELNDKLQSLLEKHDAIVTGSPLPAEMRDPLPAPSTPAASSTPSASMSTPVVASNPPFAPSITPVASSSPPFMPTGTPAALSPPFASTSSPVASSSPSASTSTHVASSTPFVSTSTAVASSTPVASTSAHVVVANGLDDEEEEEDDEFAQLARRNSKFRPVSTGGTSYIPTSKSLTLPNPPAPVKTSPKEDENMLNLLSLTLSSNPNPSPPLTPPTPPSASLQPVSSPVFSPNGQPRPIINQSPTYALNNQGYVTYNNNYSNNYAAPWAQPQNIPLPQQSLSEYPPPPWASTSSDDVDPTPSVQPTVSHYTPATNAFGAYRPVSESQPLQQFSSIGFGNTNNTGGAAPKPSYVSSNTFFGDLVELRNSDGSLKTSVGSPSYSMNTGRK